MTDYESGFAITFLLFTGMAFAQDNDDEEARRSKALTRAMQSAQMLISEYSAAFACDYAGYEVTPTDTGNATTYVVVVEVEHDACNDMVEALNDEGAKANLTFVAESKMPEMRPLSEPGLDPIEELRQPPGDYSLIHEIDPPVDH